MTLQRARAWIRAEQFAKAAQLLAANLGSLEASADLGLFVRGHSLHGEALLALSEFSRAEAEFRAVSSLWVSESALSWIRTLPSGEASQRSIQLAADAAARAALRLAESRARDVDLALPGFTQKESLQPYAPRRDFELSLRERAARDAWRKRQLAAFARYVEQRVAPWVPLQRAAIEAAEREFEQVYLVPPVLAPEWRVAVAANIGSLWGRFADRQRAISASCGVACDELRRDYTHFDESWELDRQRARGAFDTCVALSRKHRLLSEYTLVCEHWLSRNFRNVYSRLDELMPMAHWGAP